MFYLPYLSVPDVMGYFHVTTVHPIYSAFTSLTDPTFQPLARISQGTAPYPCHWIKSTVLVYVIANISFRWMSGGSRWVTVLDCALSDVSCQASAVPQTSRKRKWHAWFTFYRSRDLILAAVSLVPRWKWRDTGCPFYHVPEHRRFNAQ